MATQIRTRLGILAAVICAAGTAYGQNISVGSKAYNSTSPSEQVGRVGGYNTRYEAAQRGGRGISDLSAQSASILNFSGSSRRGAGGLSGLPAALLPGGGGTRTSYSGLPPSSITPWRPPTTEQFALISGYDLATSLETPEGGWTFNPPGPLSSAPYAAPSDSTFHRFFGMKAAEPRPAANSLAEAPRSVTAMLNESNSLRLRDAERRALDLFRRATGEGPEAAPLLPFAMDKLASVRMLDRSAYLPCLLLMHGAMERQQFQAAIENLQEALLRNPDLFMTPPDLKQYFGSETFLNNQLRIYQQSGQVNADSPHSAAFESYCSFLLGDRERAASALVRMAEKNQAQPDPALVTFGHAMGAALRAASMPPAGGTPAPAAQAPAPGQAGAPESR